MLGSRAAAARRVGRRRSFLHALFGGASTRSGGDGGDCGDDDPGQVPDASASRAV